MNTDPIAAAFAVLMAHARHFNYTIVIAPPQSQDGPDGTILIDAGRCGDDATRTAADQLIQQNLTVAA